MRDPAYMTSPCARCPRNRPGKRCSAYVPELDRFVNCCGKWYSWYAAAWQNIHRQGMEAIETKQDGGAL